MPRDSTGSYGPPAGTTAIPGAPITAEQFNNFVTDIAAEVTASATQGQIQGFSGGITTTGSGSAYALSLPTQPSDFTKLLRLTFRAHATSVSGTATITGTLTNASTTVSNVSSLAGLAVGQTITSALASSSFTGNVTNGSNQILGVSSTAGLFTGMTITGGVSGFPTGTTIQGISGTTVTLSANYTGTTATGVTIQATPGIQPNTTITALASTTTNGVTTNTITLSAPAAGNTTVGATLTVAGTSPTLAVNTIAARSIVAPDGSPLRAGEIQLGQFYSVIPDTQQNAYVIDPSPRLRLSPADTKPGYLAEKILNANGSQLTTVTVGGVPVLQLPDRGLVVGDCLNTGVDPGTAYLPRDGSVYLQSAYPALFAAIGQKFQDFNPFSTIVSNTTTTQPQFIAYGAGRYLLTEVSSGTTIYGGTGSAFSSIQSTSQAYCLVYLKDRFLIGQGGGNYIYSTNGTSVTSGSTGLSAPVVGFAYGNSLFVALASNGQVATSPDGVAWTVRTATVPGGAITFGNGLFVAVDSAGTVATSPDGIAWTSRTGDGTSSAWAAITYGAGLFVAVGSSGGRGAIMTSPEGVNWTTRVSGSAVGLNSITFGFGAFMVGTNATAAQGGVLLSSNGKSWSFKGTVLQVGSIASVTQGPNAPIAVNNNASNSWVTFTPAANVATQFRVPSDNPTFGYIKAS